jgi:hypothetical protein
MTPPPTQRSHRRRKKSHSSAKPLPRPLTLHDLPPTLTVEQAAEILGCGRSLACDLIH